MQKLYRKWHLFDLTWDEYAGFPTLINDIISKCDSIPFNLNGK